MQRLQLVSACDGEKAYHPLPISSAVPVAAAKLPVSFHTLTVNVRPVLGVLGDVESRMNSANFCCPATFFRHDEPAETMPVGEMSSVRPATVGSTGAWPL